MEQLIYGKNKEDIEWLLGKKITDKQFKEYREVVYNNEYINEKINEIIVDILYYYREKHNKKKGDKKNERSKKKSN